MTITTAPVPQIPADVAADCAQGAPIPARVAAHAALVHARLTRSAAPLRRPSPPPRPTAAPMQAGHLAPGDVIRHPVVPGGFLRVTVREPDGALFGYALHHVTGELDGRVVPVRIPADTVLAVWAV